MSGTGKTLTPSGTVTDGNSGNNYTYTFVTNTSGVINAKALTITAQAIQKLMMLLPALLQPQILLQELYKAPMQLTFLKPIITAMLELAKL